MFEYESEGLLGMRMKHAKTEFAAKNFIAALVEAEEVLDQHPDNTEALMLVGDASLELGEALGAAASFCRVLEFEPDNILAHSGLSIARFELTDFDAALDSASEALERAPEHAEAIYIQGLIYEAQGEADQAKTAFERAHSLAPEHYPLLVLTSPEEWEEVIEAAKTLLHPDLQAWFDGVNVIIKTSPLLEQLREHTPPLSPSSLALYQGKSPHLSEDPWLVKPPGIDLFELNLCRAALREGGLVGPVANGLRREAVEWLSLPKGTYPVGQDPDE